MKLYEFFGTWQARTPLDVDNPMDKDQNGVVTQEEKENFKNDLFFYILDNDDIHKENFFKVAETIYADKEAPGSVWMPMVNKGCMEFYRENQLRDNPKDIFTKEFREDICQMLDDHFRKDLIKGEYKS